MFLQRDSTIKQSEHCKTGTVRASHTKSQANTGLAIIIDNGCGYNYIRSVSISTRKGAVHLVEETPQQTGMCHYYPARPSTANSHGLPLHEQVSCNPNRRSRVCVCVCVCACARVWACISSVIWGPEILSQRWEALCHRWPRMFLLQTWFRTNLTEEGTNYWFFLLMKPYILFFFFFYSPANGCPPFH